MTKKKLVDPDKLFGAEKVFQYFKVKGKYYEYDMVDGKLMMKEVPKKDVDKHLKLAKDLATKLKDNLDAEKVLTEIFMSRYDTKNLVKLHKTVFLSKKKYKPKTRGGHCVDMKVGNHIIGIIE